VVDSEGRRELRVRATRGARDEERMHDCRPSR
jgi:hypothetical protein